MIELEVATTADGVRVVTPRGRLNVVAARRLRTCLREVARDGAADVVVDLSGTTFIDSSGLGALLAGRRTAREAGADLRVVRPLPEVRAVLELTNLDEVLGLARPTRGG